MPGEIIGEGLAFVLKLLWRLAVELILELLIIGGGRLLIHLVRPRSEPGEFVCAVVGVSFWVAVGLLVYGFTSAVAA
jgi:hypothetical protein